MIPIPNEISVQSDSNFNSGSDTNDSFNSIVHAFLLEIVVAHRGPGWDPIE